MSCEQQFSLLFRFNLATEVNML